MSWIGFQSGKLNPASQEQHWRSRHSCTKDPLKLLEEGERLCSKARYAWVLPWLFFTAATKYSDNKSNFGGKGFIWVHSYKLQPVMTVVTGKSWRQELEATALTISTIEIREPGMLMPAPSLLFLQFRTRAQETLSIYLIKLLLPRHGQRLTQPRYSFTGMIRG